MNTLGLTLGGPLGTVRELTKAEVAAFRPTELGHPERGSSLRRLSEKHKALAQALAGGSTPSEAAAATGYTPANVYILLKDPTFQDLLTMYRTEVHQRFLSVQDQMALVNREALHIIAERLVDTPEEFGNGDLRELVKMTADRTGNGPQSTTVNVNVDLATRMQRARERAIRDVTPAKEVA